jgi:hypothetical protein
VSGDTEIIASGKSVRSWRYTAYIGTVVAEVLAEKVDDQPATFMPVIKSKNGRDSLTPRMTAEVMTEVLKVIGFMVQAFNASLDPS